ncbi:unnamed protein product [Protopolystoma xenopodis]|uniref:Uncharacterized protein n=1 Tax=Protopolystoma xenopodis TaxID=117903 RepID=A0A3S5CTA0_9PLAT|nr:unnamed protein product [Protopolystoma xenopodis]
MTMPAPKNDPFIDLGPSLPPEEEFLRGKALLQSMHSGQHQFPDGSQRLAVTGSLYEHLVALIKTLLEEKPSDGLDRFEALSWSVKRELGGGLGGQPQNAGIPQSELLLIWLAIRHLAQLLPNVEKLRFWGKIIGLEANYYIVEVDVNDPNNPPDSGVPGPWDKWRMPSLVVSHYSLDEEAKQMNGQTIEVIEIRTASA